MDSIQKGGSMITKILFVLVVISGSIAFLLPDNGQRYFGGVVVVEYKNNSPKWKSDKITFHFSESGMYKLSFSSLPYSLVPKNQTIFVSPPLPDFEIEQYILPEYMVITIVHKGKEESHEFP